MEHVPFFARGNAGQPPTTLAFRVDAYDLRSSIPAVIGRRLDTGSPVRVSLRRPKEHGGPPSSYSRPEIVDFASERRDVSHPGTEPGGVLLAQNCYRQDDGAWTSSWIQSLSHTATEAQVFVGNCTWLSSGRNAFMRLISDGEFGGISDAALDQLRIIKPFNVSTCSELSSDLIRLVSNRIGAGVRIIRGTYDANKFQAEQFDARYLLPREGVAASDVVDAFMQSMAGAANAVDQGALRVEVIPFSTIRIGQVTAKRLSEADIGSRWSVYRDISLDDPSRPPTPRYCRSIIATRTVNPATGEIVAPYVTHIEPLSSVDQGLTLQQSILYADTHLMRGTQYLRGSVKQSFVAPTTAASTPDAGSATSEQVPQSPDTPQPTASPPLTGATADPGLQSPPAVEAVSGSPARSTPTTATKYGYRR